jgi:hypothetical protein
MPRSLLVFVALLALSACQTARPPESIAVGYTTEQVEQSLGRPLSVVRNGNDEVWLYRDNPRNPNDYVRGGWRRRVVFDPVRRSNVITYEAVDDRTFPTLRTHTIKVSVRDGRVAAIESTEDP